VLPAWNYCNKCGAPINKARQKRLAELRRQIRPNYKTISEEGINELNKAIIETLQAFRIGTDDPFYFNDKFYIENNGRAVIFYFYPLPGDFLIIHKKRKQINALLKYSLASNNVNLYIDKEIYITYLLI
jgi:hypothetical protein